MASEYKRAKNRAWKWFSLYIRARDCIKTTGSISRGKCVTCGKEFSFKDLQAGHFVQGRNNAVLFNEIGVNAQCKSCNIWGRGRLDLYAKYMYDTYGKEVVDGLIANKWSLVRFKESDLNRIGDKYKKKYKELVEKYGEPE